LLDLMKDGIATPQRLVGIRKHQRTGSDQRRRTRAAHRSAGDAGADLKSILRSRNKYTALSEACGGARQNAADPEHGNRPAAIWRSVRAAGTSVPKISHAVRKAVSTASRRMAKNDLTTPSLTTRTLPPSVHPSGVAVAAGGDECQAGG